MLLYTNSPPFCINVFYRCPGQIIKLPLLYTSYWNSYHRKDFVLISYFVCMCVIFYFIIEQTLVIIIYIYLFFIYLVFPCFIRLFVIVICAFFHTCMFLMELSLSIKNSNLNLYSISYRFVSIFDSNKYIGYVFWNPTKTINFFRLEWLIDKEYVKNICYDFFVF